MVNHSHCAEIKTLVRLPLGYDPAKGRGGSPLSFERILRRIEKTLDGQ